MKHVITIILLFSAGMAQIPSGDDIIDRMISIMSPENSKGTMEQVVQSSNGSTRTYLLEMYSGNKNEKALMRYLKPTSVKGQSFLMLDDGDNIWTYFPRTRRVRKLTSNAKLQGSDFTFDDMSSDETWKEDFTVTNTGKTMLNNAECWKLEGKETDRNTSDYPKVVLYVRTSDYYPLQIDYINVKDQVEKSLYLEDIRTVDTFPTAFMVRMKNHIENSETRMITKDISYDWTPPEGFFTERNLKK